MSSAESAAQASTVPVEALLVGGPTLLLRAGPLTILSDPTFDEPRSYASGPVVLQKLEGPAVQPAGLGRIDFALLSHDQHADNLDESGRAFLGSVATVFGTTDSEARVPGVTGLEPWQGRDYTTGDGRRLTVTAVPARHGPPGSEAVSGAVVGFVVTGADFPRIYFSGDNAAPELVEQIAARFAPIDIAVLHGGGVTLPDFDDATLTLTSPQLADAARVLDARVVVPVHTGGWAHVREGPETIPAPFEAAGLSDRLVVLDPGIPTPLPL